MNTYVLNNGVQIPSIAFGPSFPLRWGGGDFFWNSKLGRFLDRGLGRRVHNKMRRIHCRNSVEESLQHGCRFIEMVGGGGAEYLTLQALERAGVGIADVFLSAWVCNPTQREGHTIEFVKNVKRSLGVEQIDLVTMLWPVPDNYIQTYKDLVSLYKAGDIRAIGVSNCHQHHLERILDACDVVPAVNQIEVHPLFTQKPLVEFCRNLSIQIQAYAPLARNDDRLRHNRCLQALGTKYGKTTAQIVLRWSIDHGFIPITRSFNKQRIAQNLDIFDFSLTADEMEAIDAININSRLRYDPDNCDFDAL